MASCGVNEIATDFGCLPNDPIHFAEKFYGIGLGFVAAVALLALIYGGYVIMTSRGDPRRVSNGKSYIYYAISGLMLAIFGFVFAFLVCALLLAVSFLLGIYPPLFISFSYFTPYRLRLLLSPDFFQKHRYRA